jgi:hypothetical protein
LQAGEWDAAVRALVACTAWAEHRGHCLQFVAAYRQLAVPLVSAACDRAAQQLATDGLRIQFVLSLTEAAHLLPAIRPLLSAFARHLPPFDSWFDAACHSEADLATRARQALLLFLCDASLADLRTPQAILSLIVHACPGVRWAAIQATALAFRLPNAHKDSLEREALAPEQVLRYTLEWEQHCSLIEVCVMPLAPQVYSDLIISHKLTLERLHSYPHIRSWGARAPGATWATCEPFLCQRCAHASGAISTSHCS